jgi:uncharacterized membrane protein YfcA
MENIVLRVIIFLFVAFIPSAAGSISGIGGGIIIKPVLDIVSGFSIEKTNFLSGCTVLAMSFVSLLRFIIGPKASNIRLEGKRGSALAFGSVLGGIYGKLIFDLVVADIHPKITGTAQPAILIILTLMVLVYLSKKKNLTPLNIHNLPLCALLGLCLGLISAFLGIGGGPINIMAISWFLSMDTKATAIHSIYTIFLSQSASFLFTVFFGTIPKIPPEALTAMILGGISGGLFGSHIIKHLKNNHIDILFRIVLGAVIILSGYKILIVI